MPGFGLLMLPSGAKIFVFQYRTTEGRSRRATIGKVGATDAGTGAPIAEDMSRRVKDGGDPLDGQGAPPARRDGGGPARPICRKRAICAEGPHTQRPAIGQIERHLKPLLGKRHVAKLEQDDIRRAFAAIRDGKTAAQIKTGPRGLARVTGGEGAARYACRLLRAAFTWAVAERLIDRNPTAGIDFGTDGERETVLDAEDYARLFATLAEDGSRAPHAPGRRRRHPHHRDDRRTSRRNYRRCAGACGHERRRIGLPAADTRPAARPASRVSSICRRPRNRSSPVSPRAPPTTLSFRRQGMAARLSLAKPWAAIRSEAALPEGIGLHGLRHSLATLLAVGGAQAAEIMTSLGHRQIVHDGQATCTLPTRPAPLGRARRRPCAGGHGSRNGRAGRRGCRTARKEARAVSERARLEQILAALPGLTGAPGQHRERSGAALFVEHASRQGLPACQWAGSREARGISKARRSSRWR